MSDFATVIDAIRESLAEVWAAREAGAILSFDADAAQWLVGRLAVKQHKSPPYVGWVRGAGKVSQPRSTGAITTSTEIASPLYGADTTVTAIICGRTETETEELWHDVLRAVERTLRTDARPGAFLWVTQDDDSAGFAQGDVELVTQEFEWQMLVPREVRAKTTVTALAHGDDVLIGSADDDGSADATHPD